MTTGNRYKPRRYKCGEAYTLLRLPYDNQSSMHRWCFLTVIEQKQVRVQAHALKVLSSKLKEIQESDIDVIGDLCFNDLSSKTQYEFIKHCSYIDSITNKITKIRNSMYSSLYIHADGEKYKQHRNSLEEFSNIECVELFRFKKDDLKVLIPLLIPDEVVRIDTGVGHYSVFSRDEIVLAGLWRLTSDCKLFHLILLMGRDHSQWSRAMKYFFQTVHLNFSDKLLSGDYMMKWTSCFSSFSERIRNRLCFLSDYDIVDENINQNYKNIMSFIDCNVTRINRPGAGPKGIKFNGYKYRDMTDLQRAVFNKYKSDHGIKYQSIEAPNGLCLYLYGPCSNVNHDSNILNQSKIDEIFEECNLDLGIAEDDVSESFKTYGDSAYIKAAALTKIFIRNMCSLCTIHLYVRHNSYTINVLTVLEQASSTLLVVRENYFHL